MAEAQAVAELAHQAGQESWYRPRCILYANPDHLADPDHLARARASLQNARRELEADLATDPAAELDARSFWDG